MNDRHPPSDYNALNVWANKLECTCIRIFCTIFSSGVSKKNLSEQLRKKQGETKHEKKKSSLRSLSRWGYMHTRTRTFFFLGIWLCSKKYRDDTSSNTPERKNISCFKTYTSSMKDDVLQLKKKVHFIQQKSATSIVTGFYKQKKWFFFWNSTA